jgi:hypothetical protein
MTFTLRMRGARTASSARTFTIRMLIASDKNAYFSDVLWCQPMAPPPPLQGTATSVRRRFLDSTRASQYPPRASSRVSGVKRKGGSINYAPRFACPPDVSPGGRFARGKLFGTSRFCSLWAL